MEDDKPAIRQCLVGVMQERVELNRLAGIEDVLFTGQFEPDPAL